MFQDWDGWMRHGFLDLNVPMIYKPVPGRADNAENAAQFTDWTRSRRESVRRGRRRSASACI